jgi:DNA-binding GntR family transcriptional regulator
MTSPFAAPTPPAYRTTQERVVAQLRQAILSGQLPPGTRLTQNELAGQLEASTSPIREAVRQLAAEGLLRIAPNTRVTVPVPTAEELADVYELLALLEPLAMRKAANRITADELDAAEALLEEMAQAVDDVGRWSMLNCQLHSTLAAASGSEPLLQVLVILRRMASIYLSVTLRVPRGLVESGDEHRLVLDALRRGDATAAASLSRHHLLDTLATLGIRRGTGTHQGVARGGLGRAQRVAGRAGSPRRPATARRRSEHPPAAR